MKKTSFFDEECDATKMKQFADSKVPSHVGGITYKTKYLSPLTYLQLLFSKVSELLK